MADLVFAYGPDAVRDAAEKSLGYPASLIDKRGEVLKLKHELETANGN